MINHPNLKLQPAHSVLLSILLLLSGCVTAPSSAPRATAAGNPPAASTRTAPAMPWKDTSAYQSTYKPLPASDVLITNATILTAAGDRIENGSILLRDGKIAEIGQGVASAPGVNVVDAKGKWITPGLIDTHSHLGVYSSPGVQGLSDGNEATNPNTAEVWAEHSVWPQDPQFLLALAGGVTTIQILPGSANLFGGRGVTVKNVPARDVYAMKFPGAPYGLKMACGENPKRVYGTRNTAPSTRMGNVAGYRTAWLKARKYRDDWETWGRKVSNGEKEPTRPERDLESETLVGVLEGTILVQNHCYRADEMITMIGVAEEFGYRITAFHHAVEAYKIADVLAQKNICADVWADWWGFKMEAFDGIRENAALVDKAGGCAIIHSDSAEGIQRLNQEAAKSMAAGNRMGLTLKEEDAIRWITINPARSLGVAAQTGSLERGKMGDLVIWNGNPFSVYSRADRIYIDGALTYDRHDPARQPRMDFSLDLSADAVTTQVTPEVNR